MARKDTTATHSVVSPSLSWGKRLTGSKWLIVSLLLSLFAGLSLLTSQHFRTHDDIQVFRLNEYIQCWKDGQFPCRWSAGLGKGYGYPYFIFYPPVIYALPALIHAVSGISLIFSLNLSAYLTFPLAAYAMYRLVSRITGKAQLGAVASILYTFAPYHAVNIFVRGVYAENLAWALFPLLLVWAYEYASGGRSFSKLTLGTAILCLTHNISSMLFIPFIGIWGLVHGASVKNKVRVIIPLMLGIGISAWFFFPAITEKRLVQTESMVTDYYRYTNHFVSLKQLFLSNYWGYGASGYETEFDGMSFAIGYPIAAAALLAAAVLMSRAHKTKHRKTVILLLLSGAAALFMTHAKSEFIWKLVPNLEYIQFPWRFLGPATAFLVASSVLSLSYLDQKWMARTGLLLSLAAIVLYAGTFRPEKYDTYRDSDFTEGVLTADQQTAHLYDYLPKTARSVPDDARSGPIYSSQEPVTVILEKRNSKMTRLEVDNPVTQDIVLAQYEYPGWEVFIDKEIADHFPDSNGFMRISLPAGLHVIETEWYEIPVRRVANYLSLLSIAALLLYNIFYVKNS